MDQFKQTMLAGLLRPKLGIVETLTEIVNQTQINIITESEMEYYGGPNQSICYMGSQCYLTKQFLELPILHQRVAFFSEIFNMFGYADKTRGQNICNDLKNYKNPTIIQTPNENIEQLRILGIFDTPEKGVYWALTDEQREDLIERNLKKVRKKLFEIDNTHTEYVPLLEKFFDLSTKRLTFMEVFKMEQLISYVPDMTIEKAKLYLERLIVEQDKVLGACTYHLVCDNIYICTITRNTIRQTGNGFTFKAVAMPKKRYYDKDLRKFINKGSASYRKFYNDYGVLEELP